MQDKKYKKLIKKLATKLYIFTIKEKSEGLSFGKIEKYFKQKDHYTDEKYRELSSGTFYKYARGELCIRDQTLIEKIEADATYTGSKQVLVHPLWLIINNPSASKEELLEYMHKLNPEIRNKLFKFNTKTCVFERKVLKEAKFIHRLSLMNNLDALACLLMVLREMELLKQWNAYVEVKWQVYYLLVRLTAFEPMVNISDELYILLWDHFLSKHNPMPPDYFPKSLKELIPNYLEYYKSPYFINSLPIYHDLLKDISNVFIKILGKKASKEVELNILFWAHQYRLNEVYKILELSPEEVSKSAIGQKIINAHGATNIDKLLTSKRVNSLL